MYKKILLILACVFLIIENVHCQDFIQESVGKTNEEIKKESPADSLFIPVDKWKGKQIIFLPKWKTIQRLGYTVFKNKDIESLTEGRVNYDKLLGKIATIESIEKVNDLDIITLKLENGRRYYTPIIQNVVIDIAFLQDLKMARQKFLGDTLYYIGNYRDENHKLVLNTYNSKSGKLGKITISKLEPLKVKNIVAGWDNRSPVRFVLEKKNGEIGFIDINLSGSNTSASSRYASRFNDFFSEINPKKIHDWPTKIWNAISKGEPMIGMNKNQLLMAIGKPQDINNTIVKGSKQEQWIYKNQSFIGYIYFDNG